MTEVERQFISIIRASVGTGTVLPISDWSAVWKLARKHRLEVLVAETVKDDPSIPEGIKNAMRQSVLVAIARDTILNYASDQIGDALNAAGVQYAALKGGILKNDYPASHMRYMSDLDFYIMPEDRRKVKSSMEELGGRVIGTDTGDESYLLLDWVIVEFHGAFLYKRGRNIEPYSYPEYFEPSEKKLTEEGFALNLIGHTIFDLSWAGPGIRYILDQWIYRHRHQPQPDWNAVNDRLRKDGVYEAAQNLSALADYLFSDGEETALNLQMADYVIQGGLYGKRSRKAASEAARSGSKFNAVFRRIFFGKREFENRYPRLKKHPYLLPAAWVVRGVHSVKVHTREMSRWKRRMRALSKEEINRQKELLKSFGIL